MWHRALPQSTLEDLLAEQPADVGLPMAEDVPPDPFQYGTAPPRPVLLASSDEGSLVVARAQPAPIDMGLLPAALSELNPEYRASVTRVGLVVSVRPAFEPVAARTRGRSSHQ